MSAASETAEHPNSADAQRRRLLERLRAGAVSTIQARRELDILHPAARVMELRKRGFEIETREAIEATQEGQRHRVALYVLRAEPG
jgi:glucose-6-phosphate-specific signal transduction histidine kinase